MLKVLCICLNALFMSHDQCKRHGFKKKKKVKNADASIFIRIQTNT